MHEEFIGTQAKHQTIQTIFFSAASLCSVVARKLPLSLQTVLRSIGGRYAAVHMIWFLRLQTCLFFCLCDVLICGIFPLSSIFWLTCVIRVYAIHHVFQWRFSCLSFFVLYVCHFTYSSSRRQANSANSPIHRNRHFSSLFIISVIVDLIPKQTIFFYHRWIENETSVGISKHELKTHSFFLLSIHFESIDEYNNNNIENTAKTNHLLLFTNSNGVGNKIILAVLSRSMRSSNIRNMR